MSEEECTCGESFGMYDGFGALIHSGPLACSVHPSVPDPRWCLICGRPETSMIDHGHDPIWGSK